MNFEELFKRIEQLNEEEGKIPQQANNILKTIDNLKKQAAEFEKKAQEEDFKISEKPPQTYKKVCGSIFLGIGKSCREVPVPNPEIAEEMNIRNSYIQKRNDILAQINSNLEKLRELSQRQTEIIKERMAIRGKFIETEEDILRRPLNIFETMKKSIKSLFFIEKGKERKEKPDITPLIIGIIGLAVYLILFKEVKREVE
ncbi:MAG: hypothetical protein B6D55_02380 [Candidatus Omnitrophica bacterium 4484_70.2]|nr:MAG: hypothetical protein B6D55_02380 [Candidatus Omnitrophica bacterium 4484_70.2]